MPPSLPHAAARLRTVPIAEVCGVVASNPPLRLGTAPSASLPKRPGAGAVRRHRHERSLEMLRGVLVAAAAAAAREAAASAGDACEKPGQWTAALAEKRAVLVEALRELQHPQAEAIGAIHMLLENRVLLGLLSPAAACALAQYPDDVGLPLTVVPSVSVDGGLSSSLESTDSAGTVAYPDDDDGLAANAYEADAALAGGRYDDGEQFSLVDAWAGEQRRLVTRRGSSICSGAT
ncbi:hypothetical protein IWQ57_001872, partial [Coemansia nantahalensis]